MSYCVYRHTCPNGKVYIGITCQNPVKRWACGHGYANNDHFYNAIVKYGWDNIKHEILYAELTEEEAYEKEIALIAEHKSTDRRFGYNHDSGGKHSQLTKETKERLSGSLKGRTAWNKGVWASEETRKKLSESHKGEKSIVATLKNREIALDAWKRRVLCIETGYIYPSIKDAADSVSCKKQHIGEVCRGYGRRRTAGGYHWKYAE